MKARTSARHFSFFLPDLKLNPVKREFTSKVMREVSHKEASFKHMFEASIYPPLSESLGLINFSHKANRCRLIPSTRNPTIRGLIELKL